MVNVIEFPRPPAQKASLATLGQTLDMALSSYLGLSTALERMIDQLEVSLARLNAPAPFQSRQFAEQQADRVAELEHQLARARKMLDEIRADVRRLNTPSKT
jgi:hypothetical protein